MHRDVDNMKVDRVIPLVEQRRLRAKRIKSLYRQGKSMDEICRVLHVSKTTVFFAINRPKKLSSKNKQQNSNR